jgi:hypothetical protein
MRGGLTSENEIKIFILYLMSRINHGVYYDDIADMTYESGYVGYFDFADIFSKLIASGDVGETADKNIYAITKRGMAIAENLAHLIPAASKTKGTAVAARHSDLKKSGAAYSCELAEESDGYRLKCEIKEKNAENGTFYVSLFVKDKTTAEKIAETFRENPGGVYRGIYAVLTKNADFLF